MCSQPNDKFSRALKKKRKKEKKKREKQPSILHLSQLQVLGFDILSEGWQRPMPGVNSAALLHLSLQR
jgi:hypothetical protein